MRIFYIALIVLFAAAVVIFCVQNMTTASVSFLGWGMSVPLPLLVLIVYLLGMLSGWTVVKFLRRSFQHAREKRE